MTLLAVEIWCCRIRLVKRSSSLASQPTCRSLVHLQISEVVCQILRAIPISSSRRMLLLLINIRRARLMLLLHGRHREGVLRRIRGLHYRRRVHGGKLHCLLAGWSCHIAHLLVVALVIKRQRVLPKSLLGDPLRCLKVLLHLLVVFVVTATATFIFQLLRLKPVAVSTIIVDRWRNTLELETYTSRTRPGVCGRCVALDLSSAAPLTCSHY